MKIQLKQVILCEGKYDVIRLSALFDTAILPTHGFRIYNDRQRRDLFRRLAARRGIIIVTDSDHAGFQIRACLKGFIPPEQLTHVYIPDIPGKESRKDCPSGEGKLGVEAMETQVLLEAFQRAGLLTTPAFGHPSPEGNIPLEKIQLYRDGFSGTPGCKERYRALLKALDLPEHLGVNVFCAVVTQEEYVKAKEKLCA